MNNEEFKNFQRVSKEYFWTAKFGGHFRVWNDDGMWFFDDIEYSEGDNYFKGVYTDEERGAEGGVVKAFFYLVNDDMFYGKQIGNFVIDSKTNEVYLIIDGKLSMGPIANFLFYEASEENTQVILVQSDDKTICAIDDSGNILIDNIKLKKGTTVKFAPTPVKNSKVTIIVEDGKKTRVLTENGGFEKESEGGSKKPQLGDE